MVKSTLFICDDPVAKKTTPPAGYFSKRQFDPPGTPPLVTNAKCNKLKTGLRERFTTPFAALAAIPSKGVRRNLRRKLSREGYVTLAHATVHANHHYNTDQG